MAAGKKAESRHLSTGEQRETNELRIDKSQAIREGEQKGHKLKRRYIDKSRNIKWQDRTGRNRSHVLKSIGNQGRGRLWQADRNTETSDTCRRENTN